MTNDFDELLSAYIDGQASAAEVARVEGDPGLSAQAAELQAIATQLRSVPQPPTVVRSAHLVAALEAFDGQASSAPESVTGATAGAPVADLAKQRTRSQPQTAADRPSRRSAGLPSWLGAAAALLLVVGGLGWVIQQAGGDSADTSDFAVSSDASEAEDASADRELSVVDEAADQAQGESSEATASAARDEEEAMEEDLQADAAASQPADDSERSTSNGFFDGQARDDARRFFPEQPTPEELAALADGPILSPEFSLCVTTIDPVESLELQGFVPIDFGGELGEALVYRDPANESTVVRAFNEACDPLG